MMKFTAALRWVWLFMVLVLPTVPALAADERGTKDEAKVMTEKAAALVEKLGKEAAFKEFDRDGGDFRLKDMYVFAFDNKGYSVYHGANKALMGKPMLALKDPDGVPLVAKMVEIVGAKGEGWVDYKWFDNRMGKVMPKSSYVKGVKGQDFFVGVGVYTY